MFYKEKLAVKIGVNVILVAVVLVTGIALGGAFHKDEVVKE